jgi:hypothetical protein
MALTKKTRNITAMSVEDAANLEQPTVTSTVGIPTPEPVAALTVKQQKAIVLQTAESLGITLQPNEIKQIVKDANADVRNNANQYKDFAKMAIASYIARIEQQNQNDLAEIGNEFVEKLNQTNRDFEEGVRQTFRGVAERVAKSNAQSATTLAIWKDQLDTDTFWD